MTQKFYLFKASLSLKSNHYNTICSFFYIPGVVHRPYQKHTLEDIELVMEFFAFFLMDTIWPEVTPSIEQGYRDLFLQKYYQLPAPPQSTTYLLPYKPFQNIWFRLSTICIRVQFAHVTSVFKHTLDIRLNWINRVILGHSRVKFVNKWMYLICTCYLYYIRTS